MFYRLYESLDDLPRRERKALDGMLFDGEGFVLALDCKEGRAGSRHNTKLVLTNFRVVALKQGLVRGHAEDYNLSDLSSIEFDTGLLGAEITLGGSGIAATYPAKKDHGERFVSKARELQNA